MAETLQDLVVRRLNELDTSLHAAWLLLPEDERGRRAISYETVRRVRENGHYTISETTVDALAFMLKVDADVVLTAAGQRPRLGPFVLPSRADGLTEEERRTVIAVIDAILNAASTPPGSSPSSPADRS